MAKSMKPSAKSESNSPPPTQGTQGGEGNRPAHTIRYGNVKVTIWQNQSESNGPFYTVTPSRSWKDDQDKWHDNASFHFKELPSLAKAITDAHSWIAWQERRQASESKPK